MHLMIEFRNKKNEANKKYLLCFDFSAIVALAYGMPYVFFAIISQFNFGAERKEI